MPRKYTKQEGKIYGRPKKSKEEALEEIRKETPTEQEQQEAPEINA